MLGFPLALKLLRATGQYLSSEAQEFLKVESECTSLVVPPPCRVLDETVHRAKEALWVPSPTRRRRHDLVHRRLSPVQSFDSGFDRRNHRACELFPR